MLSPEAPKWYVLDTSGTMHSLHGHKTWYIPYNYGCLVDELSITMYAKLLWCQYEVGAIFLTFHTAQPSHQYMIYSTESIQRRKTEAELF